MDKVSYDSLIKLLQDPDDEIIVSAEKKILEQGSSIIPYLENLLEDNFSSDEIVDRVANLVEKILLIECGAKIIEWKSSKRKDLIDALIIIGLYFDPYLKYNDIKKQFSEMEKMVLMELDGTKNYFDILITMNRILFSYNGFQENVKKNIYCKHYNISHVFIDKFAPPSVMGAIYLQMARNFGVKLSAVNIMSSFILGFKGGRSKPHLFINPYRSGAVIKREEMEKQFDMIRGEDSFGIVLEELLPNLSNIEIFEMMIDEMKELHKNEPSNSGKNRLPDFRYFKMILNG